MKPYTVTRENDQFDAQLADDPAQADVLAASRSDALHSMTGFRTPQYDVTTPEGAVVTWGQYGPAPSED